MKLAKTKLIWMSSLLLTTYASYKWTAFGLVFLCLTVIILGLINQLLSIQSKELGLYTGTSAALITLAMCAGASLSSWQIIMFTIFGAIAGYGFVAMSVGTIKSNQSSDDELSSKFTAGGGGDFGGGGANGKY